MQFLRTPDSRFEDLADYPFAPHYLAVDDSYKAGARRFPSLATILLDDAETAANRKAWRVLERFDKPFMCAFSDGDPVTGGLKAPILKRVPGCRGVPHRTITNAGHFPQQEQPQQCVQAILDLYT
ncbi:hypothetical protein [Litorivivens sp.]|uniref:hypothetical protein n=1 Tax=Litorivivens sp. TaxID=2020868 RepID=UPI0035638CBE